MILDYLKFWYVFLFLAIHNLEIKNIPVWDDEDDDDMMRPSKI